MWMRMRDVQIGNSMNPLDLMALTKSILIYLRWHHWNSAPNSGQTTVIHLFSIICQLRFNPFISVWFLVFFFFVFPFEFWAARSDSYEIQMTKMTKLIKLQFPRYSIYLSKFIRWCSNWLSARCGEFHFE